MESKAETLLCSVVMPVHNESQNIAPIAEAVLGEFEKLSDEVELIFVDDGSTDDSWESIVHASQVPKVRGFRLSRNFGKEAALAAGLDKAEGAAAIIMDADFQHPPEHIPEMIRLWKNEGFDIVHGIKIKRGVEPFFSKAMAKCFYFFFHISTRLDIDKASDFKLLSRPVINALVEMPERGLFFRGMSSWLGFNRVDLPFEVSERRGGRSSWSTFQLFRLGIHSIATFSSVLLQIVTILGGVFLTFAIGLAVYSFATWYQGQAASGFTTIYILQLFIGSLIMISLGIIGLYIERIYVEVKRRPRYVISNQVGQ